MIVGGSVEGAGFASGLEGAAGIEVDLWPSTWPRSRVGSMILRTRFLSSFVSGDLLARLGWGGEGRGGLGRRG